MQVLGKSLMELLKRLRKEIRASTGKGVELYLFGSYAKGDYTWSSDIDLLALVPEDWTEKDSQLLYDILSEYNARHRIFINLIIRKPSQLSTLTQKVLREGLKVE
jgi:predicted nucleotidyltransferase